MADVAELQRIFDGLLAGALVLVGGVQPDAAAAGAAAERVLAAARHIVEVEADGTHHVARRVHLAVVAGEVEGSW